MSQPVQPPRSPFAVPFWIGLASLVGLVSALIGDGAFNVVSWLVFAGLIAIVAWAWFARERGR